MSAKLLIVIGRKGSGKTHLVKTELIYQFDPVIVFDTLEEYGDFSGLAVADNIPDLLDLIEIGENIRIPADTIEFEDVCYILLTAKKPYTLLVDEFHILYENHMSFKKDFPSFRTLILTANHNNVNTILTTQRPIHLPKEAMSQADVLYCFHVWHPDDIKFLSGTIPDAKNFAELQQWHYKEIQFTAPLKVREGQTSL